MRVTAHAEGGCPLLKPLFKGAEAIGEIDGFQVFYNSRGFYFYWNEETKFLLESWLTYPSYPYGWLS
ncbi:hypothetical protein CQ86_22400 [Salmonella enterica subsp. enterica serovar Enteritidis]|nr:hypothetical protein [Salmonella enterica subsp. enterica serovar Enteritidis]ECM0062542.1 hypothetical protein [Salmonella enterica subsp. enterica serovar Enteritidis]EGW5184357.1 hypothetical protein [Salmonella enterica subsp. enterica serovar Enteritidis]EGW5184608.1 hypothetical protein [Salmonella enterica subsp. enterica serovar Enteritidis]